MKQILCLSNEPWSKHPHRTQQLVSRLRDAQVLYFAPSSGRAPLCWDLKGRKVRPNITVYPLPAPLLPVNESYRFLFQLQQRRRAEYIARRAARHRFRAPLLWTTHPSHVHLLDHLEYSGLVYDCGREWDQTPPPWEGSLAHAADVVFAASPQLSDRLSPCSANIALIPNGLNRPLFSPDVRRADPLPRVRGPVLGWTGTLRRELDLSPVLCAAQSEPGWTFVLLGRRGDNPLLPRLSRLPNVLLPGPCPADEVPDWLYRCDVLLDLLREDRPYDDVVTSRLYEYFATGRPVVSMLWPGQVERFPDVMYAAHDEEDFLRLCRHALEEAPGFAEQRRMDHAAHAGWSDRSAQVQRILTTAGLL